MKTRAILILAVLVFGVNSAIADAIVEDNFNSYVNGSVVGQGGWESYANGNNFLVQEDIVFEGSKALYCNVSADSVIGKQGNLLINGRQIIYVKTENRDSWDPGIGDGNVQIRISNSVWGTGIYATFRKDGNVTFYNWSNQTYTNFATYDDETWTALAIEWCLNGTARYQVSGGTWTSWESFSNPSSFTGFDHVSFAFGNPGGYSGGGVYFDTLGSNPVPEPATIVLLITGLVAGGLFFRRK